jgi:maleylpyruvate isomerase
VTELYLQIETSTGRLLDTIRQLTDDQVTQPSLLPGWTRAHVLTHLARGADAMCNLLTWARTGVETPAYASQASRDADIATGARRPAAELYQDVERTAGAFNAAVQSLPDQAWRTRVRAPNSAKFAVTELLPRRLVELELHHTDLGAGYTPADWPASFAEMGLPEPMRSQRRDRLRAAGPGPAR